MGMLDPRIPASHFVAVARGPDDVWVGYIWNCESGFAASHTMIPTSFVCINGHARTSHVSVVLHVAVEVVRNLVVDSDVIHLADRQFHAMQSAAVHGCDAHTSIVGDDKPIGVCRINPDIVRVSSP